MPTTLIRDASLLFPEWFPFEDVPDAGGLFDHVTFDDFEEQWTADTVTLSTSVEVDTSLTFGLFGFDVGFGDPIDDVTTATLSVELESEPVITAIGVLLLGASLATADEVADAVDALGLEPMSAQEVRDARSEFENSGDERPSVGDVRVELSELTARIALPEDTFQVGQLVEVNGDVVGIEPHPNDPRPVVSLGTVSVYADTDEGVGIDVTSPDAVSLPPLLFRDTQVGLELRDVAADLSAASTPGVVTAIDPVAYDAAWRGLYVGELTVWGLQTWLPFLPDDVDSERADGTSVSFTEWVIDRRGLVGAVTVDLPENHPDRADAVWKLDQFTLAFDRDWVPETLSATVDLSLAELSDDLDAIGTDGDVTLAATLRYDPERPAAARFGFDLVARAAEDGPLLDLTSDDLGDAKAVIYTALAGLAVAGGPGATAFVGALAALEGADILTTDRFAIENVALACRAEKHTASGEWKRIIRADLDLAAEFTLDIDAADLNTPVGVSTNGVTIEYVTNHAALAAAGVTVEPVTVDWQLDDVAVSLQADANVGNAITISSIELRTEGDAFLIELGVETEGDGDVAITGVPDAIIIAVDDGTVDVRLGGGMPVTLLVPGALYARGELQTGADAVDLPPAGDGLSWDGAMAGSLRGFLIGNGTASTPEQHRARESYMLGLDVGLLSASRSDGMTTLVLTVDGTFNPGIPLGTSGVGLYGLGLVYAQNARPALPEPNDYAGWYMDESPAYTTHATKWEPALDEWGFGASTVIGSAPDNAKSWSAKVGLIILLPGPVIILAGTGDTFSEKPSMGGGDQPPFAAVVVLDLEDDVLTVDLQVNLEIPENGDGPDLVTVEIPVEIFVNLDDASDFHLYMGRYAPPEARVVAEALGMLDLSAYLMLSGSPITGLPTVDPLPGLALALGGEASVDWGLKSSVVSCYWYADAAFHLGVSLAEPPLLVGLVEVEGGLVVKVFGLGFDLGVYARLAGRAPDPFELTGEVGINIDTPWPFDDINTSVSVTFGDGGDLPPAPDPIVDCQLRPRRSKQALSVRDANVDGDTPVVPVDPVFALSFDVPMNGIGSVGSFTAATADGGADVWDVVTTERAEKDGVERRHRLGYQYTLTDCTVTAIDDGTTVVDAPATWTPGGDAASGASRGSPDGAASASGGQPARKDLLLFTHEATYLNRTVGLGGELSNRQTQAWDPCRLSKAQPRRTYDATGLPAGDALRDPHKLTLAHRDTPGDPPVWGHIAPAGSAAVRRIVDARTILGGVVRPPFDPSQAPRQPLQRDRVLGVPQAIPRSDAGMTYLQQLIGPEPLATARREATDGPGHEITPPVDPLDVVLSAHEHSEVRLLVADDVQVVAVGLIDGEPATDRLPLSPIGQSFQLQGVTGEPPETDAEWRIYSCTPPRPVDAIRLFAVRPPNLQHVPAALDDMAASVLSVEVRYSDRMETAERETLTTLTSDLVDAALQGDHLDMLEPDRAYELSVTVEATHAEQWGDDPVETGDPAGSFTETFSFRTADAPPVRLRGTAVPDRSRDDWDVASTPDGSVPHYLDDPAAVAFRSERTLATYAAHGDALALRFVDETGDTVRERANAIAQRASDLPVEQAAWRSTLEDLRCIDDDVGELWREATAEISSLLAPETRYTASLRSVDENASLDAVDLDAAPAVYTWRFRTSRWESASAHLTAHDVVDELTDALDDATTLWTAAATAAAPETTVGDVTMDDRALDDLLFGTLGLPPRRPPSSPEAIRVWRWDPDTDTAEPVAVVLDGPEPLLRDGTTPTVRQASRTVHGRFVTGEAGARVLFVPDADELVVGHPARIDLSTASQSLPIPLPTQPPVLTPHGGAP